MTEKEKAKAYDEAIERAKKLYGNGIAEEIFSELKESDDEKIKNAILNHLKKMWGNCQDDVCGVHVEDAIAWIEKQDKKSSWKPSKEEMDAFLSFRKKEGWWLEDYALFQALCAKYNDSRWFSEWPKELRVREKKAMDKARKEQKSLVDIYCVLQYFFFTQWDKLKKYANEKGVKIVGDIPIFVASDSVDAWTNTKLLQFDKNCVQKASAGVPPDAPR